MPPILEAKEIVKTYRVYRKRFIGYEETKNTIALEDINFGVNKGQFISIIGPSGCGKTTLLRIFAGLVKADGGQVLMKGKPVDGPSPNVGMVFQNIGLLPWRTAQGNVELAFELRNHRAPTDEEKTKAHDFVSKVGLESFEESYPYQLSGGMQQRIGLARALVTQPEILLADEPFGALDAQTRLILQDELLKLYSTGNITVLFVTHDLDEAIYLSDQVIVLTKRPGRIKRMFDVDLERPRFATDTRSKEKFISLKREVWETLKEEIVLSQSA
ncbi:MAG: ABC transporter ATP-binding protein [Thaumarchaeota archaeon]|nr:ABC transporter ATP-binding protein [Nitrososphaerota archaeon]